MQNGTTAPPAKLKKMPPKAGDVNKLCRTVTPFGTDILLGMTNKKHHCGHTPWQTGSPPFWLENWGRVYADVAFERTQPQAFLRMSSWSLLPHLHLLGIKSYRNNWDMFYSFRPVEPQSWPLFWRFLRHQKLAPIRTNQLRWPPKLKHLLPLHIWIHQMRNGGRGRHSAPYRVTHVFVMKIQKLVSLNYVKFGKRVVDGVPIKKANGTHAIFCTVLPWRWPQAQCYSNGKDTQLSHSSKIQHCHGNLCVWHILYFMPIQKVNGSHKNSQNSAPCLYLENCRFNYLFENFASQFLTLNQEKNCIIVMSYFERCGRSKGNGLSHGICTIIICSSM